MKSQQISVGNMRRGRKEGGGDRPSDKGVKNEPQTTENSSSEAELAGATGPRRSPRLRDKDATDKQRGQGAKKRERDDNANLGGGNPAKRQKSNQEEDTDKGVKGSTRGRGRGRGRGKNAANTSGEGKVKNVVENKGGGRGRKRKKKDSSSEDYDPGEKEKKAKVEKEELKRTVFKKHEDKEKRHQDGILNRISRLFEKSTQGCAAVCFVNNEILITDNEIHQGSTGLSEKYKLIKNTMGYFFEVAKIEKVEGLTDLRKETFKRICLLRIKGEASGSINLDHKVIENMAEKILEEYDRLKKRYPKKNTLEIINEVITNCIFANQIQKTSELTTETSLENLSEEGLKFSLENLSQAYFVFCQAALLARDFLNIEKFLIDSKNENSLKQAFACGAAQDGNEEAKNGGYRILAIDADGVHAEMKMVEYLLSEGILKEGGEGVYIGISKLCCYDCALVLMAVNDVVKDKEESEIVSYRGYHADLIKGWPQPNLLSEEISEFPSEELVGQIRERYKALLKKYEYFSPPTGEYFNMKAISESSLSIDENELIADFTAGEEPEKAKKWRRNASNQWSNNEYLYQEDDLNIIGSKLVKDPNKFIGIIGKENVEAKLQESRENIKDAGKIFGIYKSVDNQWITFCIRKKGENIKVQYTSYPGNIDIQDFKKSIRNVFGGKAPRLDNRTETNELVVEADYGILALQSLKAFANSEEIAELSERSEQYQDDINDLRKDFANEYAQQVFEKTSKQMVHIHTIWKELLSDKSELAQNLKEIMENEGSIEEKQGDLLAFIGGARGLNDKEKSLLSILTIEGEGEGETKTIALLEELIEMDKLEKEESVEARLSRARAKETSSRKGDLASFTDEQLIEERQRRGQSVTVGKTSGDINDKRTSQTSTNTKGSSNRAYKGRPEHNAFNEYWDRNYEYQTEDMRNIGGRISGTFENIKFIQSFGDSKGNDEEFLALRILRQNKESIENGDKTPIIGSYAINSEYHWVAFSIIPDVNNNKKVAIICKNSIGKESGLLQEYINNIFPKEDEWEVDFKVISGNEQKDSKSCGLFTLKNMEIMAKEIVGGRKTEFEKVSFYDPTEGGKKDYVQAIKDLREDFAVECMKGAYELYLQDLVDAEIKALRSELLQDEKEPFIANLSKNLLVIKEGARDVSSSVDKIKVSIRIDISGDDVKEKLGAYSYAIEFQDESPLKYNEERIKKALGLEKEDYERVGNVMKVSGSKVEDGQIVELPKVDGDKIKDIKLNIERQMKQDGEEKKGFLQVLNINERLPSQLIADEIGTLIGIDIVSHEFFKLLIKASLEEQPAWLETFNKEEISIEELADKIVDVRNSDLKEAINKAKLYFGAVEGKQDEQDRAFKQYVVSVLKEITQEKKAVSSQTGDKAGQTEKLDDTQKSEDKQEASGFTDKEELFIKHAKEGRVDEINDILSEENRVISSKAMQEAIRIVRNTIDQGSLIINTIEPYLQVEEVGHRQNEDMDVEGEGVELGGFESEEEGERQGTGEHLKRVEKASLARDLEIESIGGKVQYNLHKHLMELNPDREGFAQELANFNESAQEQRDKDFAQSTKSLYTQLITGNKGTVTILPENNHLIDHNKNVLALLKGIESGKIPPNTVIALERKQYGDNLGKKDVIELVNIISHNENYPTERIVISKEIENSLIYQDAKLYRIAQERGVIVIGIEGKGLDTHKDSQEYNSIREKHMVEVLSQVTRTGRNVYLSIGGKHIEDLEASMNEKGIKAEAILDVRDINFVDDEQLAKDLVRSKPTEKAEDTKIAPDKEMGRQ
jgi:hypothetical protein